VKRLVLFTPGHDEPGGASSRSRLIAAQLAANGWQVRVVTRAGTLWKWRLMRTPGLTVIEVPGFNRRRLGAALFYLCAIPLGFVWGIRSRAFVAVQLMSTSSAASICSGLTRRPFLALSTTSGTLSETAYIRATRLSSARRRLLGRAAWLVAQTEAVAHELAELTANPRVVVLPNPVELVVPPPLDGRPTALFAGRFSAEKDLLRLLSAWESVVEDHPQARLTLAGAGGEYRSVEVELRAAVQASSVLRQSVELPGWIDNIRTVLVSADVFVLPSLEEGMSNALLEACAHGRLVVASDIAPNRAIVGDEYPLIFRAGDRDEMAACLTRAFRMGEDERTGVRALLAQRIGPFSSEAVIPRLEELITTAERTRHCHPRGETG
jgi:glycosyltransferase involved in cell wall biosynthesis